ncbi:hypothetical protein LSTR_LSTR008039 [Laodelphax striatellus]|uniref:cyclin-dependent kinase n=1 Tax=Laodelphax striatellus TaxID=195883 RepID=A0A482XP13_LAOST|nr:hypothetical protein LSTR_LSTR008039 [Laodelphax striatellus]
MTGGLDSSMRGRPNYEELNLIGNGAYGTVYKARDLSNGNQIVAIKKLRVPLTDDGVPMSTVREIALLRHLDGTVQHPNIVRLLDVCHGQRLEREQQLILFLVFEHVDQDLMTYKDKCPAPGLSESRIRDLMFQILSGVDFLHSRRIVHRDLKPQNILVTNSGDVKIADFGLAKTYDFEMRLTSVVVTLWYRAPEVLLNQSYGTPVDIWSCGCIMGELFSKVPLCAGNSEADQLDRIFQVIGTPSESEWPETVSLARDSFVQSPGICFTTLSSDLSTDGQELLKMMLQFNPVRRISALNALQHQYFASNGYTCNPYSFPV